MVVKDNNKRKEIKTRWVLGMHRNDLFFLLSPLFNFRTRCRPKAKVGLSKEKKIEKSTPDVLSRPGEKNIYRSWWAWARPKLDLICIISPWLISTSGTQSPPSKNSTRHGTYSLLFLRLTSMQSIFALLQRCPHGIKEWRDGVVSTVQDPRGMNSHRERREGGIKYRHTDDRYSHCFTGLSTSDCESVCFSPLSHAENFFASSRSSSLNPGCEISLPN